MASNSQKITEDQEARYPKIIVGTYEDFVIGYQATPVEKKLNGSDEKSNNNIFRHTFADRAHSGSVRTIAASSDGRLVASGGIDETIHVYNLSKLIELGVLQTTGDGAVNCVRFFENTHLFAASEDGNIYVFDCTRSMALVKTLTGHKKGVTNLAIHPSGKIMLSVAKDCTLRTWNLIKGRCAYITNLHKTANLLCWSPQGDKFLLAANETVDVYEVETGSVVHTIPFEKHVNSIEFIDDKVIIVGNDSNHLIVYDLDHKQTVRKFEVHENRVKAVKVLYNVMVPNRKAQTWIVTISSDGNIKLWHLKMCEKTGTIKDLSILSSVDTGARLTCLTAI